MVDINLGNYVACCVSYNMQSVEMVERINLRKRGFLSKSAIWINFLLNIV